MADDKLQDLIDSMAGMRLDGFDHHMIGKLMLESYRLGYKQGTLDGFEERVNAVERMAKVFIGAFEKNPFSGKGK